VLEKLNESGIFPGVHYTDNTEYKPYEQSSDLCPKAREASNEIISLPMHMAISKNDVELVSRSLVQIVSTLKNLDGE
jgi:dTDP-4-amino-4,6-dideoxygalactose transaminase